MNEILTDLFRHNRWANLRLVDACGALTDAQLDQSTAGAYGSIQETLTHLVGAEGRYVWGLGEGSDRAHRVREDGDWPGFATLRDQADWSGTFLIDYAAGVSGDPVHTNEWHGRAERFPASLFLAQAVNHATDHRSQIATMLTMLGVEPPSMDGWTWDEETRPSRSDA